MTYRVYHEDIIGGLAADPNHCPVARAIKRHHPTQHIHVGSKYVVIGEMEYMMPERVRDWIRAYDQGARVLPTRFELISPMN